MTDQMAARLFENLAEFLNDDVLCGLTVMPTSVHVSVRVNEGYGSYRDYEVQDFIVPYHMLLAEPCSIDYAEWCDDDIARQREAERLEREKQAAKALANAERLKAERQAKAAREAAKFENQEIFERAKLRELIGKYGIPD